MGYAFISYSSKNKTSADMVRDVLKKHNIDVWMAPDSIPAGQKYASSITRAVRECCCVVLVLSEESQISPAVDSEIEMAAIKFHKTIISIRIDAVELNDQFVYYLSNSHIVTVQSIDDGTNEMSNIIDSVRACTSIGASATDDAAEKEQTEGVSEAVEYRSIGESFKESGDFDKALNYYLKAVEIYKPLAKENPDCFESDLAACYSSVGFFYSKQDKFPAAEEYYMKAIEIYKKLSEKTSALFEPDLALSYHHMGDILHKQEKNAFAAENYLKAVKIYEKLAKKNPERFEPDLASSYSNMGNLYKEQHKDNDAIGYYLIAIEVYEKLARKNPERFEPDLADNYHNVGKLWEKRSFSQAKGYYQKSVDIYKMLAKYKPDSFEEKLAILYIELARFYEREGHRHSAEEHYLNAIEIYKILAKYRPDGFEEKLVDIYIELAHFHKRYVENEKAEEQYLIAIGIGERLESKKSEEYYISLLLKLYEDVILFYCKQKKYYKAESFWLRHIRLQECSVKKYPQRLEGLARSYCLLGNFYKDLSKNYSFINIREHLCLKAIEIYRGLAEDSPEEIEPELAKQYYFLYNLTKNDDYAKTALELSKKYPGKKACKEISDRIESS